MEKLPLISVIVPIYNVEMFLKECVDSIICQSYKNLEIILVDDGSPDHCPDICDEYKEKDSRIKVIHKQNGGLSDARNAGLEIAGGEYISFIDSDDWIEKDMYEKMMKALLENNCKLCECNIKCVYEDRVEELSNKAVVLNDNFKIMESYISDSNIKSVAWDKLYHKSLLENLRFEVGKYHEDEFFTYLMLARVDSAVIIEDCLYNYRQREKSITAEYSPKRLDAVQAAYKRTLFVKEHYKDLYIKAKYIFYTVCICNYSAVSNSVTIENKSKYQRLIQDYLDKEPWKFKEILHLPLKKALMMLLSNKSLESYFKLKRIILRK